MNILIAHTDGSCLGNPGVGGYCGIISSPNKNKEQNKHNRVVCGKCCESTTNNRMELQAVIAVVDWVNKHQTKPHKIEIRTDSQYLCNCSKHEYAYLSSENRPNNDLWVELIKKAKDGKHVIKFVKVKAHSGDVLNAEADKIAREQAIIARHEVYGG